MVLLVLLYCDFIGFIVLKYRLKNSEQKDKFSNNDFGLVSWLRIPLLFIFWR